MFLCACQTLDPLVVTALPRAVLNFAHKAWRMVTVQKQVLIMVLQKPFKISGGILETVTGWVTQRGNCLGFF